ncbi:aspartyl protease family protein [Longimicrobium sp.]|uniref:aspartyl protease family protein n=1 Tax=Longimicrobium sp. TaxID=2029185 RepID=UPI002E2FC999|nr:aspartyl protease family protein [Longimicrobium sp.]HEX6039493.1 aspartyl protease family protein [Longimicrobium sp.]
MSTRRWAAAATLCLLACSGCAPALAPWSQTIPPDPVPFAYEAGHVVLPVRVNGSAPLRFILDTGFPVSAVDLRAARAAGLQTASGPQLSGVGPAFRQGRRARSVRLDMPGAPPLRVDLAAFPLDGLATQSGGRIDGILGMDVIERWAVEIDYATRTLRLHAPGSYRCANGCTEIPWVRKGGEWFVTARVMAATRPPVAGRFRLDTGSGGALALTRPFVDAHDLLAATPGTVEGTAVGIGGMSRRRVGRLAALSIGPFVVERPVTAFAQDSVGEMARADFGGVIGADILRRFRLVLDAHSQRILVLEYRPDPPLARS